MQEISQISRALKLIARDLDVPVIAISQLSRAVEARGGQAPAAVRPARVRLDRAGRRPRHVRLPRRLLQRRESRTWARPRSSSPSTATARSTPSSLSYVGRYTRFDNLARPGRERGPCSVVVGAQWGDEGKGKIVDLLAERRRRGRPLPGRQQRRAHARASATRRTSCGWCRAASSTRARSACSGTGCVIDPEVLIEELDGLSSAGHRRLRPAHLGQRPPDHAVAPDHRRRLRARAGPPPDRHHPARHRPRLRRQGARASASASRTCSTRRSCA